MQEITEQAWRTQRKARFTASQIYKLFSEPRSKADKDAGLLSETAKGYIVEVALEQLTGYRKVVKAEAMDHGIEHEDEAFEAFNHLSGLGFEFTGKTFYSLGDNSGASPDGVKYDGIDVEAVADVKCPFGPIGFYNQKMMMLEDKGLQGVPAEYFYQMQLQMLATGASRGYLVRYLADRQADKYGNSYEYGLPLEHRIFWKELQADAGVHDQILAKIAMAEAYKNKVIEQFLKKQSIN